MANEDLYAKLTTPGRKPGSGAVLPAQLAAQAARTRQPATVTGSLAAQLDAVTATGKGGSTLPPPGHQKVSLNLRKELWAALNAAAAEAGTPPVTIIEALLIRYLESPLLAERVNERAWKVGVDRRRLAKRLRLGLP